MTPTSRLLLTAGLFVAVAFDAHAAIERTVEKTFPVQPGGTLHVETQGGDIRVLPSDGSVVKIIAKERIVANSDAEADALLKKLSLTFEQNGGEVSAIAKYEERPMGLHFGTWPPVTVSYTVTVPASFATDLNTSGGSITVGDLTGKVRARTSGGDLKLGRMANDLDAHTSGGSVSLEEGRRTVNLGTSGGDIVVGRLTGSAELATSGGSIKIESVEGGLHASTSGGDVRAGFTGPLKEECVLGTSGGSVKITVDKNTAFRLDAATSGGQVDATGLTLTLDRPSSNGSQLAGAVNGGGPLLKLRTSGGDIVVRTH